MSNCFRKSYRILNSLALNKTGTFFFFDDKSYMTKYIQVTQHYL